MYLEDSYKREHSAKVLKVTQDGVVFDETIFYPQGGGQPSDTGTIISEDGTIQAVDFVSRVDEVVVHRMNSCAILAEGQQVTQKIDWEKRYWHMRLHSAGHLIDHAVQFLQLPFEPLKACHFPHALNVEFTIPATGNFDTSKPALEACRRAIEEKVSELIALDCPSRVIMANRLEEVPEGIRKVLVQKGKVEGSLRMILFEGCPEAVPCGGTHVHRSGEVCEMKIRKVVHEKGVIRVAYSVSPAKAN